MNREELITSLLKKGFRPDGHGGYCKSDGKEPKNPVPIHNFDSLAAELRDSKLEHDAGEALGTHAKPKAESADRIIVRITRCAPKLLDLDNAFGGTKGICDELRYCGLIHDDNPEEIELQVRQKKVSTKEQGTLIEIIYP